MCRSAAHTRVKETLCTRNCRNAGCLPPGKTRATTVQQLPYPEDNSRADQLKIVARLIKGGLKTRVYMVSYNGFDTHSMKTSETLLLGTPTG